MSSHTPDIHQQRLAAHAEWEWYFLQVQDFIHQRGHHDLGQHPAGEWLRLQIRIAASGALSAERQQRLTALGITWEDDTPVWQAMLGRLRAYLIQHKIPRGKDRYRWLPEPLVGDLADWLREQRALHLDGTLQPDRFRPLRTLQMLAPLPDATSPNGPKHSTSAGSDRQRRLSGESTTTLSPDERWEARLTELTEFQQTHGHCDVPNRDSDCPQLAHWVSMQRQMYRKGKMPLERIQRLEDIGFDWAPTRKLQDRFWEQRFKQMCAYQKEHGHTRAPRSFDRRLWHWQYLQREGRRKGSLSPVLIARLDAIGFEWHDPSFPRALPRQERMELLWERKYQELQHFHREHGHCHVIAGWVGNPRLASWVLHQREFHTKGKLRPDRQARLEALGFLWSAENIDHDARWESRFQQLCAYQKEHGHTRVPKNFDRQLYHWRHIQREWYRKGVLKPERVARLDAIGFQWEDSVMPQAKSQIERWELLWQQRYEELLDYQRRFGTTHVPVGWPENPQLATWAIDQRELYRRPSGMMRPDRQAKLDAIGFLWHPGQPAWEALWEKRYAQLCAFHQQHGHTRVFECHDRQLCRWRLVQREWRKKGTLKPERIARLDAIGFEWGGDSAPASPQT